MMPFSVIVAAIAEMCPWKMYDCLMTIGSGGGSSEENAVALLCFVPSYNSKTANSILRCLWFQ